MTGQLKILSIGTFWPGETCLQRFEAMKYLGHHVERIETEPNEVGKVRSLTLRIGRKLFRMGINIRYGFLDVAGVNQRIVDYISNEPFDILWIDKGLTTRPDILAEVRRISPRIRIIGYSPDDMAVRHNQSPYFLECLPLYDVFVTTKSYGVAELHALGCPRVEFCGNAYDSATHRPIPVDENDSKRFGGPVGFIGAYEVERARSMLRLASAGIPVRIWGPGWERCRFRNPNLRIERATLIGDDYARAICSFDVNLGFLRKINRDLQTQRSIEIPACGGFMLAERTNEHIALFEEGIEAEYFGSDEELIEKTRYYLNREDQRKRIAKSGRERCLRDGYSNKERLADILARIP